MVRKPALIDFSPPWYVFSIAHNTGEPLDVNARQQFHVALWRQASLAYEGSEFDKALKWYNYSLSLFPPQSNKDNNIAKLQVGHQIIEYAVGGSCV